MSAFDISVVEAWAQVQAGALRLIDLRSDAECQAGSVPGAFRCNTGVLSKQLISGTPTVLMCARGVSASLAVEALREQGHGQLFNLAGGFAAWQAAKLPVVEDHWFDRYRRQIILPEVGEAGQLRLAAARVALVGVGGLGCPVASYLAAAGVGELRLIDPDRVERSNLQRQLLYSEPDVGRLKVQVAQAKLQSLNPEVNVITHAERLEQDSAARLLDGVDLIIDGSDNLSTRAISNRYAVHANLPLVFAAVERWQGQMAVFDVAKHPEAGCYHCLFPELPNAEAPLGCAEIGVMGAVPAVMGSLQATAALAQLLGAAPRAGAQLLTVDLLAMRFKSTPLRRDPCCTVCGAN